MKFVLLITAPIDHSNAWHAYYFAKNALEQGHQVSPFFYNEGVNVANRLILAHDQAKSLTKFWQDLAKQYCESISISMSSWNVFICDVAMNMLRMRLVKSSTSKENRVF